jgi:hypothetical protein
MVDDLDSQTDTVLKQVTSSSFASKAFFESNPALGGDVKILFDKNDVIGDEIYKTFEIESFEDGECYLDAWINVPLTRDGYPESLLSAKIKKVR